jgi:maltose alpha-D-glucosyltransferase / alpha-amylase
LVKDATRLCTDVFATSFGRVGTCHSGTGSAVQRLIVDATTEQLGGTDRLWYKDAIIYQLHVKSFFDGNDDGIGDFPGLISKLDYIADLGVNAIWLLPFYPSPRLDDGYDISAYRDVHPDYGTLSDFRRLVRAAHARNIRLITDLAVNHTSDQHPWFSARP